MVELKRIVRPSGWYKVVVHNESFYSYAYYFSADHVWNVAGYSDAKLDSYFKFIAPTPSNPTHNDFSIDKSDYTKWKILPSTVDGKCHIYIDNNETDTNEILRTLIATCKNKEIASRIVLCVNALANIPDPEAWVNDIYAKLNLAKYNFKLNENNAEDGF